MRRARSSLPADRGPGGGRLSDRAVAARAARRDPARRSCVPAWWHRSRRPLVGPDHVSDTRRPPGGPAIVGRRRARRRTLRRRSGAGDTHALVVAVPDLGGLRPGRELHARARTALAGPSRGARVAGRRCSKPAPSPLRLRESSRSWFARRLSQPSCSPIGGPIRSSGGSFAGSSSRHSSEHFRSPRYSPQQPCSRDSTSASSRSVGASSAWSRSATQSRS